MRETLLAMKPSIMRRHLVSANGHEENVGEGGEREREREGGRGKERRNEGSVERASLRETQDTGCKGGPRQGGVRRR